MLFTTSYIVIDKTYTHRTFTAYHECVSLNEFNKSPIISIEKPMIYGLDFGSIIDENYQQVYKYKAHNYELARVLGEDKENSKILVYGAKIGEQILDTKNTPYHNYIFYQRGDLLLLKQLDTSNKFSIIHNINQAKIKAERDKFGQKAR